MINLTDLIVIAYWILLFIMEFGFRILSCNRHDWRWLLNETYIRMYLIQRMNSTEILLVDISQELLTKRCIYVRITMEEYI